MSVYRQRYEDWFNNLTDTEREAETARLNSNKSTRKPAAVKIKQEPKSVVNMSQPQQQQQQQQQPQQLLANLVKYVFFLVCLFHSLLIQQLSIVLFLVEPRNIIMKKPVQFYEWSRTVHPSDTLKLSHKIK